MEYEHAVARMQFTSSGSCHCGYHVPRTEALHMSTLGDGRPVNQAAKKSGASSSVAAWPWLRWRPFAPAANRDGLGHSSSITISNGRILQT